MKLELVMLTTVISMITERKVEALFDCYEHGNLTGTKVTLGSSLDITSQLPNGPGACKVPANSTVIFYSGKDHRGIVNVLRTDDSEVFRPTTTIGSILELGQDEGIFVFPEKNFQGGLFTHFNGEKDKVPGNVQVKSVAVIGKFWDWTIARRCNVSDCQRTCMICLLQGKNKFRASFIRNIDSTDVQQILTVLPGACLGKSITGLPRIPCPHGKVEVNGECRECVRKCDPYGVADKKKPCDEKGACVCHSRRTGKTCSTFKQNSWVYCYKCTSSSNCKPGSFQVVRVKGLCVASEYYGQTGIIEAWGNNNHAHMGCIDFSYKYECICDTSFCNDNITKYLNDPNYPRFIF